MPPINHSILLTDLYQLTMLQGYFQQRMRDTAVFEFFVRKMPEGRNFLVAAGLDQVLDYLEKACFSNEEIAWLEGTSLFGRDFLDHLGGWRFTGAVHAMPEGTVFFPDEPILRVTAPLPEAQLVETRIINLLQFQTIIASKAARMKLACPEKIMVDFGFRRAHGAEAGLLAARASYLAGFSGTSTVQAGQLFDIPIYGTMAHSFIQAHDTEIDAFRHFALAQPQNVVLLIDTYDTLAAAEKVVLLAPELEAAGITLKAVRIDSGDLAVLAKKVRKILDAGGLSDVRILTSGNLDEYVLKTFSDAKVPIDGFGIGTRMVTASDAPYLDCAYKMEEYGGMARRKKSTGKETWPGRKQVYRKYDKDGVMRADILTVEADRAEGEALIKAVMTEGKRIGGPVALEAVRRHFAAELATLPPALRGLSKAAPYEVKVSRRLEDLAAEVDMRNARALKE